MMYHHNLLGFCLFMLLLGCSLPEPKTKMVLTQEIETLINQEPGRYAVAFMDLIDTSNVILVNETEMFHAASTMKTPVMVEVYKQAVAGNLALEDSVLVKNTFYSIVDSSLYEMSVDEDSEAKLYGLIGQKTTLYSLVYDMITYSSNLATNIVIDLVDARKVTQTMRTLGAPTIEVLRGVEDIKAYEQGLSNRTAAIDLMRIFKHLGMGTAVSEPSAGDAMIDILLDQHFNKIIPAKLPKEVKVAHKTGWISSANHDSGLVLLPDGRKYVLILLSKDWEDTNRATAVMAEISDLIYQWYIAKPK